VGGRVQLERQQNERGLFPIGCLYGRLSDSFVHKRNFLGMRCSEWMRSSIADEI
jgi:hypothetical protein